jgi:hypothetical protein
MYLEVLYTCTWRYISVNLPCLGHSSALLYIVWICANCQACCIHALLAIGYLDRVIMVAVYGPTWFRNLDSEARPEMLRI